MVVEVTQGHPLHLIICHPHVEKRPQILCGILESASGCLTFLVGQ